MTSTSTRTSTREVKSTMGKGECDGIVLGTLVRKIKRARHNCTNCCSRHTFFRKSYGLSSFKLRDFASAFATPH